ncbi:MAG: 2-dehydropantoate 2-reductase N-terminal domain-containing protein, partial [Methanothrix sp.]|nr:2-dehydropantoate 2-reductase N-terminal domain-containing protein [Methanothrix sp.]
IARHLGEKYIEKSSGVSIIAYDRNMELIEHLQKYGTHLYHFSDKILPENISFTANEMHAVKNSDIVVMSVSSQSVREILRNIKPHLKNNVILLNTAKALELGTAKTFSEVMNDELYNTPIKYELAKLSGGTFAEDLLNGAPIGADIACVDSNVLIHLLNVFSGHNLRLYGNTDLIGVEYAGAFKNIIAILAGTISGLGLPYGSETYMISRAARDAKEIAISLGAKKHTFSMESQCWGNDLWMSCTGESRNRDFGILIGKGLPPKSALKKMEAEHKLVEGYYTIGAIPTLSKISCVNAPIFNEIYKIIYENKNLSDAMEDMII